MSEQGLLFYVSGVAADIHIAQHAQSQVINSIVLFGAISTLNLSIIQALQSWGS